MSPRLIPFLVVPLLAAAGQPPTAIPPTATCASGTADPGARQAAQRGVNFVGHAAAQWEAQNNCYGCHVQAVTLEALTVGKHNQYDVSRRDFAAILDGMLHLPGGARGPDGLSHPGFPKTAKIFGGVAFARYDQWVDGALRDDLLKVARQIRAYQREDGAVVGDHQSYPVTAGVMQSTYQAMQTWRQAYARSADDAWLPPIRKAEKYLQTTAARWEGHPDNVYLQDVNYALMGFVAAGVGSSERVPSQLVRYLTSVQREDGGWGFVKGGASEAFATGQTLYALRMAGLTDCDPAIARGTRWLVRHQKQDGGWGAGGSGKAEAMWGVLGLVSVDVMTLAVNGIRDGEHVAPEQTIDIDARDNGSGGVEKVELWVDDLSVKSAKGSRLSFPWKTNGLSEGMHVVEAVATNAKGQTSRRRFEVYAGNVFVTQLGSRFEDDKTQLTFRDIAPTDHPGTLELHVFSVDASHGEPKPGREVFASKQKSEQGPMSFAWDGKSADGKAQPRGRYLAQVAYRDASGKVVQNETTLFFQDTEEKQLANFGEVGGALSLRGAGGAANAEVELVDARGNVVQRTRSTEQGQYRFKNVDKGEYKIRVKKDGFAADEVAVKAAPAVQAEAPAVMVR